MNKILLIIAREYKTRVLKKSFILLTLLTPLLFAGMIFVPFWLSTFRNAEKQRIFVIDQTSLYSKIFVSNSLYTFEFTEKPISEIKTENVESHDFVALLVITDDLSLNPSAATLYSNTQINPELKNHIRDLLSKSAEEKKINSHHIPNLDRIIRESKVDLNIKNIMWSRRGQEHLGSSDIALAVGMITAMLIYMFIVVYGAQVMSGVLQEKTSRIVEVIISSVKPFELMMGKIIGIALVGLTQFVIWLLLTVVVTSVAGLGYFGLTEFSDFQTGIVDSATLTSMPTFSATNNSISEMLQVLNGFDFFQLISLFLVYFLAGYFLYASLFAAVGSAVDSETDTQQFSLPLTLPILFAVYAAIYSAQNPNGPLAFWCSLIPFTSPVVMMVRLPFGVPTWEIVTSIILLITSFIASTWVAGKIYKTGILMYGKKASWREIWKWIRY